MRAIRIIFGACVLCVLLGAAAVAWFRFSPDWYPMAAIDNRSEQAIDAGTLVVRVQDSPLSLVQVSPIPPGQRWQQQWRASDVIVREFRYQAGGTDRSTADLGSVSPESTLVIQIGKGGETHVFWE